MNNIKITILGADGYTCQIPRIKDGMIALGHILTKDNPDIIFSNDPRGYNEALSIKEKYPNAYVIFNFLDIPWHMPNIEKQTMMLTQKYFMKANAVTAISFKVKKDLEKFYKKEIHVIYNPIKDVHYNKNIKKNNMFLYVGRANDPIKRIKLVHDSLLNINNEIKKIKICGSENAKFGNYLGVVKDDELNKLYNSSKYLCLPSKAEGIGLPMIEAMICGAIPITCNDNETAKEFSPVDFICDPKAESIVKKILDLVKIMTLKEVWL